MKKKQARRVISRSLAERLPPPRALATIQRIPTGYVVLVDTRAVARFSPEAARMVDRFGGDPVVIAMREGDVPTMSNWRDPFPFPTSSAALEALGALLDTVGFGLGAEFLINLVEDGRVTELEAKTVAPRSRSTVLNDPDRGRPTTRQRAFISHKIPILVREGRPQRQAIAIAYRMAGVPQRTGGVRR